MQKRHQLALHQFVVATALDGAVQHLLGQVNADQAAGKLVHLRRTQPGAAAGVNEAQRFTGAAQHFGQVVAYQLRRAVFEHRQLGIKTGGKTGKGLDHIGVGGTFRNAGTPQGRQVVRRFRVVGVLALPVFVELNGLARLAMLGIGAAQQPAQHGVAGRRQQAGGGLDHGLAHAPHAHVEADQVLARVDEAWRPLQHVEVEFFGGLEVAAPTQQQTQIALGVQPFGVKRQGAAVAALGVVYLAVAHMHVAQVVVKGTLVGIQFDGLQNPGLRQCG